MSGRKPTDGRLKVNRASKVTVESFDDLDSNPVPTSTRVTDRIPDTKLSARTYRVKHATRPASPTPDSTQERVSAEEVVSMHDDDTHFYDTDEVWEDVDDEVLATCSCTFNLYSDTSELEDAREHF
jgi:hypothetical protein